MGSREGRVVLLHTGVGHPGIVGAAGEAGVVPGGRLDGTLADIERGRALVDRRHARHQGMESQFGEGMPGEVGHQHIARGNGFQDSAAQALDLADDDVLGHPGPGRIGQGHFPAHAVHALVGLGVQGAQPPGISRRHGGPQERRRRRVMDLGP